ncbi:MAG: hypothetical protein AB1629_01070 [Candidatus Omnitrophota bacterium]
MRILANYGYKNNGDTYSVTFETVGDVPKDKADTVVDELFALAKAAIQRQLNPDADPLEFPPKEEVTVPQPTRHEQSRREKNGNGKPQLKDPDAPATGKQKSLIIRLAKERGQFIEGLNNLTMQEASEKIDELMAVAV